MFLTSANLFTLFYSSPLLQFYLFIYFFAAYETPRQDARVPGLQFPDFLQLFLTYFFSIRPTDRP